MDFFITLFLLSSLVLMTSISWYTFIHTKRSRNPVTRGTQHRAALRYRWWLKMKLRRRTVLPAHRRMTERRWKTSHGRRQKILSATDPAINPMLQRKPMKMMTRRMMRRPGDRSTYSPW